MPALWDLTEYSRHRCDDYSHKHLSRAQVIRYEREGRIRWLRHADHDGDGAVLTLTAAPAARHHHQAAPVGRVTVRDASCRVGELLVMAVLRHEAWAVVMLANTRRPAMNDSARNRSVGLP